MCTYVHTINYYNIHTYLYIHFCLKIYACSYVADVEEPCSTTSVSELKVFKDSYALLCDTLIDVSELLTYFVTEKIITKNQQKEINAFTISSKKVSRLLLIISGPLKAGDSNGFYTMLRIMKTYGVDATQRLADRIITKVDKSKLPNIIKSKELTEGLYLCNMIFVFAY